MNEPQLGFSGFIEDFDPATVNFADGSTYSKKQRRPSHARGVVKSRDDSSAGKCEHNRRKNTCKDCCSNVMAQRRLKGEDPISWGSFCKHGYNKHANGFKCPFFYEDPDSRPQTKYNWSRAHAALTPSGSSVVGEDAQYPEPEGFTRASSAQTEASDGNPENRFETKVFYDTDGGGSSYNKVVRKARMSSRKARMSSRKARMSSRKAKRSSKK